MRIEDNGTEVGEYDEAWNGLRGEIHFCAAQSKAGWFCTLSRNHSSLHHVAHGNGRVMERWLACEQVLEVAEGL